MADTFTVDATDWVTMARQFGASAQVIEEELVIATRRVILVVEGLAKRYVKVDQGHLRRSITSKAEPIAGGARGIAGTNTPYAKAVERGRRAGAPMPPAGSLIGWKKRHGMERVPEFVLRRAISRKGIPPSPYLTRALAEVGPQAGAEYRQVAGRAFRRMAAKP